MAARISATRRPADGRHEDTVRETVSSGRWQTGAPGRTPGPHVRTDQEAVQAPMADAEVLPFVMTVNSHDVEAPAARLLLRYSSSATPASSSTA